MKILAVDDEQLMLDALRESIQEAAPQEEIYAFRKASDALAFAKEHPIDVAFLDIRMRGMDGLELGRWLLEQYPQMNLIFCTSYDEYISEAFRSIRCNGYITKPVDAEQISQELAHLRVPLHKPEPPRVRIHCLGRFEVFIDGLPIKFENSKTKEFLAYLVNACGGICGNQEIIAQLWEDDFRHDSYFKKIRKDLIDTLERCGCGEILYRQRGGLGINVDKVSCDYYDWKKHHTGRKKPEEYMTQYSWRMIPDDDGSNRIF
ncbi:MAG: response regulator [Oscillospiraceae bacterium]|nr:response regulator [Oscillospiraceae bacterium]